MKRIFLALILSAVILLSSACQTITQGEVYDKQFIPAHDETYVSYERMRIDGNWHSIPVTRMRYCPDTYYICIRKENDKGTFDKARYEVGKERYEQIQIGDEISFE